MLSPISNHFQSELKKPKPKEVVEDQQAEVVARAIVDLYQNECFLKVFPPYGKPYLQFPKLPDCEHPKERSSPKEISQFNQTSAWEMMHATALPCFPLPKLADYKNRQGTATHKDLENAISLIESLQEQVKQAEAKYFNYRKFYAFSGV